MRYTGYIRPHAYNGYVTVDVWDSHDGMYPVMFHQKYQGYTIAEIKKHIRDRLEVTRMKWEIV